MTFEEEIKILEEINKEIIKKGRLLYSYEFRGILDKFIVKNEEYFEKELEVYKKALAMACDEIGDRVCSYYRFSDDCKSFCELYDLCAGNIEYANYYLEEARKEE